MKIVLFANGEVGLEVARHFTAEGVKPALAILVRGDERGEAFRAALPGVEVVEWQREAGPEQVAHLRAVAPDLGIVAWWPFLLRPEVFTVPPLGCLNFHPSLLPHGRGKHPNFWALREGTPFGVSLQFVDAGIDTGPVAFQRTLEVSWEDTGATLHGRARAAVVELFKASFHQIMRGDLPRQSQPAETGSFHWGRELEPASQLDLDAPTTARAVLNTLRARTFTPHPGAWFTEAGTTYDVRVEIKARPNNLTNL